MVLWFRVFRRLPGLFVLWRGWYNIVPVLKYGFGRLAVVLG